MTRTILIPVTIIQTIADMRRAQKNGNIHQAHILEEQVDQILVNITNALDYRKAGHWYDDLNTKVESEH